MIVLSFRRTTARSRGLEFCERCGTVCDSTCRAEALRDDALLRGLVHARWLA